jgi:membrane-associated phospholipid phosphatase
MSHFSAQETSASMHVEQAEVVPTARYETARLASTIIHPIIFPLVCLGVALDVVTQSVPETLRYVALAMLLTSVPISVLVVVQVVRHKWTDLDVSARQQRYALYPFGVACMLALAIAFARIGAPQIAVRSAVALSLANVVNGLVNLTYKVSAHATGAAASAALLWLVVPFVGVSLLATLCAVAVGWSRVELKRHTAGQVVLGWSVGVLTMIVAYRLPLPGWL